MPAPTLPRSRALLLASALVAALLAAAAPTGASVQVDPGARVDPPAQDDPAAQIEPVAEIDPGAEVDPAADDEAPGEDDDGIAAPRWAPAGSATVHPGVQMVTEGSGCTANFVFYEVIPADEGGGFHLYLGYSAHCAGTGGSTGTNGCTTGSRDLGTPVTIRGADHPGALAYSSWLTMQQRGEKDANTCRYNDFALVRIDPRDHDKVNPSIPFFGGPEGVNSGGASTTSKVYSYGNSSLRLGLAALSPKEGYSVGTGGGGWTHPVYTVSPGIPGDSGSAFLDAQGRALGSLSTLAIAPLAGSNGVADIKRAVGYANAHRPRSVTLAVGTEPFQGGRLP